MAAPPLLFPSREWFVATARALHEDSAVQAAARDFGPVTVGIVIERGDGLASDFCVHARLVPGQEPKLEFPDDEDETEELEPDYLVHAPHRVCRRVIEAALAGKPQDPLGPVLNREVKLKGDLQRLVRFASAHKGAGAASFLSVPTRTHR